MSTRRPKRSEDARRAQLPACPPHLKGEARREWRRTGRRLVECGLMTAIDGAALAVYCQAWARWIDAEGNLSRFGAVLKSPTGFPMQSPYLAIANKAMEQLTKVLVEFGMSPSSRSRVSVAPAPGATDVAQPASEDQPDPRTFLRTTT